MPEVRTIVTFQSPAFNTTERKDYFINDCCYGDDVAKHIINNLRSRGTQTDPESGQEDFGWYFGFKAAETDYQFIIGHRPADENNPAIWMGWIERKAGLIGSLLGARKKGIQADAAHLIHSAILSVPQVSGIRWHLKHEFDAGKEELGKPEPTV